MDALPRSLRRQLATGRVDLDDPAATLQLLRRNAVVGVKGFFSGAELVSGESSCEAFYAGSVSAPSAPK